MDKTSLDEPLAPDAGASLDASHVMQTPDGLALRASRCPACAQSTFPASSVCPFCLHEGTQALPIAGAARLYAFTRVHVAPRQWRTPYAMGYGDFPSGLRLFAKLSDPDAVWQADQAVTLRIQPALDGGYRYHFEGAAA